MSLKKKLLVATLAAATLFGSYKLYQSQKNTPEKTGVVQEEVEKETQADKNLVDTEKKSEIEQSSTRNKNTKKVVKTVSREYEATSGKLTRETVVEETLTEIDIEATSSSTKASESIVATREETTIVESSIRKEDKGKGFTSATSRNPLSSGFKAIVTLPTLDFGVSKELVCIPDVLPVVGGTAGNAYLTVVHPTLGLSISKPLPINGVEGFIGLGVDLTESELFENKFVIRGAVGVSLNLSF